MSHTNSTTNYALPQFLTSDKPAWLTDVNNAFSDIDTAIYAAQSKADTAYTDAGNAQIDATTAINDAAAADAKGSGAIASIEANFDPTAIYSVGAKVMYNSLLYRCIVAVVTPGAWTGSDNWERVNVDTLIASTESKIGSLSSLATTDKASVVNAINEVNGKLIKVASGSGTTSANANLTITRTAKFIIVGAWCNLSTTSVLPWIDSNSASTEGSTTWNLHFTNATSTQAPVTGTSVTYYYAYIEI